MRTNIKKKKGNKGFTIIELLVTLFIFSLIMVGIVSVFVSSTGAHQKAKSIKSVKENVEFALSSIAKDVRMGKIENGNNYATGGPSDYLLITRNRGGRVCYRINSSSIAVADVAAGVNSCSGALTYKKIIDLAGTNMTFDSGVAGTAKFRSCISDNKADGTVTACNAVSNLKRRGWAEINLNIIPAGGKEMEADQINVQTIVSSRDYGWDEI